MYSYIQKITTILIVAHRLSTIAKAKQVYVLKNGNVIEQGSFINLCNKKDGILNHMLVNQYATETNNNIKVGS